MAVNYHGICFITLASGGSIGPRYVLQLSCSENFLITTYSATTEAREKISTYLESLEF